MYLKNLEEKWKTLKKICGKPAFSKLNQKMCKTLRNKEIL